MKRLFIAIIVVLSGLGIAKADPGDTVVLYQPDAVLGQRLGDDAESLATFILECQDCWAQVTPDSATRSRTALIVAFGAGRQSGAWIMGSANTNADEMISKKLINLQTPHLTDGFVAFAVLGKDYERELKKKQKEFAPPLPNQWKQVVDKHNKSISTDDILDLLLPKKTEVKAKAKLTEKPIVHAAVESNTQTPEPDVVVPQGVVYKPAPSATNELAKAKIIKAFSPTHSQEDLLSLSASANLICGPYLWSAIKTQAGMTNLTCKFAYFMIPQFKGGKIVSTVKKEGQCFQTSQEITLFWRAFGTQYDFKTGIVVRKLTPRELKEYWAMIPYDIEEPIFIVESLGHKLLLHFISGMRVGWIDDYQALTDNQGK